MSLGGRNFFQHIVAFDQFAKGGVLAVEKRWALTWLAVADEELAACRIGVLRAGHRDDATHVRPVVELSFDLVARIAGPPFDFFGGILGLGITTLDHEAFDNTLETGPVIQALLR